MQHFCSIFRLNKCIWESWLSVVFVVCPLGENLLIYLFHQKRVILDTFQCSIHFRKSYQNFTIYNIFLQHHQKLNIFIWSLLIQTHSFLTSFHFCELPAWWKSTHLPILTKLGAFESSKAWKAWKSKLCSFCKLPAWWKSTHLPIVTKLGSFESSKAWKAWNSKLCSFCKLPA